MNSFPYVAFGLGSNIGDGEVQLHCAVEKIRSSPLLCGATLRCSEIYRSEALLPKDAPKAWDMPFVNQVVVVHMARPMDEGAAYALLDLCKEIERDLGRVPRGHWGPREIDVDIIMIEGFTLHSDVLTIPHPQAHLRDFVMIPLRALGYDL
ncbi:MAG: 2-amino-4-hydroxy-6-hydroxymethyldihydropteridine diphosphokinase [Alphaproteobacteria bacterium]|nr:MAG: 2-amino-4-hydroxy-6-hydroxymethyldihydropteridine diphosphokinase [Alphaproteobacteria bacterium]TAF15059.1 MAG: 2-amino-4-hydroxy-6-hydroxymethyldihydropteridine diphosphokinase [Alphaproteobacteria bacterium]TAF40465.1 MAG: 2-amino-4-hydroxy-6-hydroxymethyldihydropteridine diphosphokinase [Alphaproteobacteria bacterium]TAF76896.1 MAG: 2-amino-4-hydroxy-6-hydroxymethyldihydropteridine diphosphokinase [Alphaproteobacteria bacterium]